MADPDPDPDPAPTPRAPVPVVIQDVEIPFGSVLSLCIKFVLGLVLALVAIGASFGIVVLLILASLGKRL